MKNVGALLNTTFGNVVGLIITTVALKEGEIRVVQSSVMGSIISKMLLVLGGRFLAASLKYSVQEFNETAQTSTSLMALACIALIIPAAFSIAISDVERSTPGLVNLS